MDTLILAIDFGTTTTIVCGDIQGVGNPRFLIDDNSVLIPSVIFKRNDGVTFYGKEAEAEYVRPKSNGKLFENFKMWLLDEDRRQEGEACIKEFLREHIYNRLYINQKADFPEHDNVIVRISHPSKWSKELVQFMADAIKESGFQNSKIETVAEPLAVSVYSMQSRAKSLSDVLQKNTSYNTMTIDMGGGTCDVVICKTEIDEDGKCHVSSSVAYPSAGSSESCGGRDIDIILMHYIWEQCQLQDNFRRIFTQRNARIWKEERVSKDLKRNEIADAPARVSDILSTLNIDISSRGTIDRATFEQKSSQHWKDFRKIIQDAVSDYQSKYNISDEDIDFIFVTGGHSQWYCVKDEILKSCNFKKISNNPNRFIDGSKCNPNETVARGLCCYGEGVICNNIFRSKINIMFSAFSKTQSHPFLNSATVLPYHNKQNYSFTIGGCECYNHKIDCSICISKDDNELLMQSFESFKAERYCSCYEVCVTIEITIDIKGSINIKAEWESPHWCIPVETSSSGNSFWEQYTDSDGCFDGQQYLVDTAGVWDF